ncbi:MAG: HipA N-terminal domain-containing protein [Rikenellaceae bacterium]
MKAAGVYSNKRLAGRITESDDRKYTFQYDSIYLADPKSYAISLTMPKQVEPYHSEYLFPFFFNMLSEGSNRAIQSRLLHFDEEDYFEHLLATAHTDTIGAITVKRVYEY